VISEAELDQMMDIFTRSVREVLAEQPDRTQAQ
jgi:hypothetical protein